MTATVDWEHFGTHHWGKEPVRLPAGETPDPERAFAVMTRAAAPFRAGTRARAVPDVAFFTDAGRLRAPAGLLPGEDDADPAGYLARLDGELGERGRLLSVEHPLLLDFSLWARTRELVTGLWEQVGWPALPVTAELVIGDHGYARTDGLGLAPGAAVLMWVLEGEVTVRLWRETGRAPAPGDPPDLELRGRAGDLLHWPADHRPAEVFTGRCLVLRLAVRADHRAAMSTVKNLLVDAAQHHPRYADDAVPFLPCPPPAEPDGRVALADPVQQAGTVVRQLSRSPELARTLRHQWAARRSAAALEPPPPPLPESSLGPRDRIRAVHEIVVMPDGPGRAVWAVNGHLLPVSGSAGERILRLLPAGAETSVDELSRAIGAGERNDSVLALLRALHRLRAIERTGKDTR